MLRARIEAALDHDGVAVLPPGDALESARLLAAAELSPAATMLDPWYNKGVGGVRDDYFEYVTERITACAAFSGHVFVWGFPEIVAGFLDRIPAPHTLTAWLTWYYKNNPSVIRGWRSAQMACLHLSRPEAPIYPEHFLNEAQLEKKRQGKLRYMPGPPSVIEAPLNIGFIRKKEQTGHPAQKPEAVYEPLLRMVCQPGDLVFDPMCGSGTTGAVARKLGLRAILADMSDEYTGLVEARLGIERLAL